MLKERILRRKAMIARRRKLKLADRRRRQSESIAEEYAICHPLLMPNTRSTERATMDDDMESGALIPSRDDPASSSVDEESDDSDEKNESTLCLFQKVAFDEWWDKLGRRCDKYDPIALFLVASVVTGITMAGMTVVSWVAWISINGCMSCCTLFLLVVQFLFERVLHGF